MVAPKSCPGDQFACGFVVENTTRQHVVADGRASTNFFRCRELNKSYEWLVPMCLHLVRVIHFCKLEENDKLVLTPFEKNVDIWRQLWRVLERSDPVANGMMERRGSKDGGRSGAKVDGDGQGIAAADPGRMTRGGTPPGSYIVLLHISLLSRVPISGPKFCWLIAMPGWFSCWCCPGFQVQQLPSSKGTGLVFAILHQNMMGC
uniref:Uncharacterized protein n=1 Tax=Oryza nivara TaxID=4536 RepID=A0A0E0JB07_ORYNI